MLDLGSHGPGRPIAPRGEWWRSAAIYQLYVRSFADSNGDGTGDLAGVRAHLSYLAGLGIDAIWFNPWYPSPMSDAGYDISDYRAIEPVFGTLADADSLIAEAHAVGIRIIIDVVPNHGSDQHPWFAAALAAAPGSAERDRFWFRPGRGAAANFRRTAGSPFSAVLPGRGSPSRTGRPVSGTCTCSLRSSQTSTGQIGRCGRTSKTCCGSGSTGARTASGSTRPRCSPRTRHCRRSALMSRRGRPTRSPTATTYTRSTGPGARWQTSTPAGC